MTFEGPPGSVMRMARTLPIALSLLLLASAACTRSDPRQGGGVAEVNTPLPALTDVPTLSGEALPSTTLSGPASVINVWATWCEPCRREQPALLAVQDRYSDRGVGFLGINYNDDREPAERWVEQFDVTYPSLYDPDGRTAAMLGFPFLPDTFVVDGSGTIRYVVYGETDEAELSRLIDSVLSDGA